MSDADQRLWGMLAHLFALFAGLVAPLVIYLVVRDRGAYVRRQSANALNIDITLLIAVLVSLPLMLVLVGFVTFFGALVYAFVLHIIGAVKANAGEAWDPPLVPRLLS